MRKILDPKNLPYFGAIVQAVLFAIAGNQYFPVAGWLVGLGMGAVVNWSMAIASSRISDIARNRKTLGYLSLFALVCVSPTIICSTLGWSVANFSWAIAADLSITLTGSIVGRGLIAEPTLKKSVTGKPKKEPVKAKQVARKHVKDDELLAYLAGNAGASQQQVADYFGVTRQAVGPRIKKLYEVKQ